MTKHLPFQVDYGSTNSNTWALPEGVLVRYGRGDVMDTALSPDERFLTVVGHLGLWWYDMDTRKVLTLWEAGKYFESIAFSGCGEWIAASSVHTIKVWEVKSGNLLMELDRVKYGCTRSIIFSPDRKYIAAAGSFRTRKDYFSVEVYSMPESLGSVVAPVRLKSTHIYGGYLPVAFSPDSHFLAFGAPTGAPLPFHTEGYPISDKNRGLIATNIAVCDIRTGQHLTTLSGFNDVESICFSPDGRFVAVDDKLDQITVYDISTGWTLHEAYTKTEVTETDRYLYRNISYSPKGTLLVFEETHDEGMLIMRDLDTNETHTLSPKKHKFDVDFEAVVWTIEKEHITRVQLPAISVTALQFSPNGKTLLSRYQWNGIASWNIENPDEPPKFFKPIGRNSKPNPEEWVRERYMSVVVSPEGQCFVASGNGKSIRLWELGIDTPIAAFSIQGDVSEAAFSPSVNLLACRDYANQIYIWDVATADLRDTYTTDKDERYRDLVFSPNGAYLASTPCHIYDVIKREKIDGFTSDLFKFQAFSSDSRHIWDATHDDEEITLWNIDQCKEVLSIVKPAPVKHEDGYIHTFALSACGQYLACGLYNCEPENRVHIYDLYNGRKPIVTIEIPETNGCPLAFSLDNTLLASGSYDGTILLWDMKPYL